MTTNISTVNKSVCCKVCQVSEKTWKGADPKCAFVSGAFDGSDNWNCATANLIRNLCVNGKGGVSYHFDNDQNYATISTLNVSFPETLDVHGYRVPSPVCLWVGWYKNRGRTEGMWLLFEDLPPRTPTEEECLLILKHYAD